MFFGRWRRGDPLEQRWLELCDSLGLERVAEGAGVLEEQLDLPAHAALGPVFRVARAGSVEPYVFHYRQSPEERSRTPAVVTGCLLLTAEPISPVSWRASRKLHSVIASLQASATGGEVAVVPGDAGFNEKVTVVARETERLVPRLTAPVRRVLERSAARPEPAPTITVGERRILLTVSGDGIAFDAVEYGLSDVLSLYAALASGATYSR